MAVNRAGNEIDKVVKFYSNYDEQGRLSSSWGQIEYVRTQDIILRYLQPPPAVVLDVGGAAGRYSCWLAEKGYKVHLVDPVPLHVEQAKEASQKQAECPIASCSIGDARHLEFIDQAVGAVMLMGPLYHLISVEDRHRALMEAYRVLKTGGHLFAVGISRFASTIDGLVSEYYHDSVFQEIMKQDLETGQHRNPTDNPAYFMDTYFHHPQELINEVSRAGFENTKLIAVEGISYLMKDLDTVWNNETMREFLLEIIERTESEPSLIGASSHMMCVGVKPWKR